MSKHPINRTLITIAKPTLELLAFTLGSYLAVSLRFGGISAGYLGLWAAWLPVVLIVRIVAHYATGCHRLDWRRTGLGDLFRVMTAITAGSLVLLGVIYAVSGHFPRWVILDWFITGTLCVATRAVVRTVVQMRQFARARRLDAPARKRTVLIVGAGHAGAWIARAMREDPASAMNPVGFVDDDPSKWSLSVHGIPVLGAIRNLAEYVRAREVEQVVVAIPSVSSRRLREIVGLAESTPAQLTIVPGLPQILDGRPARRLIRNISVEDLLERTPVRVDMENIANYLTGKTVLITGAGGSIGSELCRQISSFRPERIVLLGQGENSVFLIDQEMRRDTDVACSPVIADIKDRVKLEKVFQEHRPDVVFHAAAHKHVPLMEANPEEAIKNNIFGTRNLADLSVEYGVRKFVMISTDKAVNPTSVMGASKRVAEMVVQSLAQRIEALHAGDLQGAVTRRDHFEGGPPVTEFAAVRFGNVLGSRGSVVPTMQRQIERGGPVTVTHPDMVRFFMTIPEAVQLVVQAGAMSRSGEIFVLDMGKPVKIMDLARNLIRLSGFVPNKDIAIKVTGIRPGEKLYEEVLTAEEGVTMTNHEKICVAHPVRIDHDALHETLERLEMLAQRGDAQVLREALRQAVPTYTPKLPERAPSAAG
jgi:FlaA1/EpsC-like NDP-sugar epimerase